MDRYAAAWNIVLDGIIAKVIEHLVEQPPDALHTEAWAGDLDGHILFCSAGCQNGFHIHSQFQDIHIFFGQFYAFIQLRKPDNIFNEINQTGCFFSDMPHKTGFIFRLDHTASQQFRAANDALQGCFQFVGHIGGEFPAHLLCIVGFRYIHR